MPKAPKLRKRALEALHGAEIRKIAMLGMNMDVTLAYGGDSDNVLSWVLDNQDKLVDVNIDEISKPTKPGRGLALREEVISYVKEIQKYLKGEQESFPIWDGLEEQELTTEERELVEDVVSAVSPIEVIETTEVSNEEPQFPPQWLTKKGTPDRRKAAVRAVLDDGMAIEDALKMEAEMKYIPKKAEASEPDVAEDPQPEIVVKPQEESVVETPVKPAVIDKAKVSFRKKSLSKPSVDPGPGDYDQVVDRLEYTSKALSEIKQQVFENKFELQALSKRVAFIENALLFLINSVVLEDTQIDTLEAIPQPSEY